MLINTLQNRNSTTKLAFLLFVLFGLSLSLIASDSLPKEYSTSAANALSENGVISSWLLVGPFSCALYDSIQAAGNQNAVELKDSTLAMDYDFVSALGGEDEADIKTRSVILPVATIGIRKAIQAKKAVADVRGIINFQEHFSDSSMSIVYAFCYVESFVSGPVRIFLGVDGLSKIWVNGNNKNYDWDVSDSCIPLTKIVDVELHQGMNTLLLKSFLNNRASQFTVSIYDKKDSLAPFVENITSLSIEKTDRILKETNNIVGTLVFNIPVPKKTFSGPLHILTNENDTILNTYVSVGDEFTIAIPDTINGTFTVNSSVKLPDEDPLKSVSYFWKGDFELNFLEEQKKIQVYQKKIANYSGEKDPFKRILIEGLFKWCSEWFSIADSLLIDRRISQFNQVKENFTIIDTLLNNGKIRGDRIYSIYLGDKTLKQDNKIGGYDPSRWLNYKYPKTFALPDLGNKPFGYNALLYIPKLIERERKKIPLLTVLHGEKERGYDIQALMHYGPLEFIKNSEKLPCAILCPQCKERTIWESGVVKSLIDQLMTSNRLDKKRVYLSGEGMGGFCTWHLATTYPREFSAIIPMNAGGHSDKACLLTAMPTWVFHGVKNPWVPLEETKKMVGKVKQCGSSKIKFSIYPEYGENITAIVFKNKELYSWVLKKKL